jgi:hypothetical protein
LDDRAPIHQQGCNAENSSMVWALFNVGHDARQIVNVRSGKCLDDPLESGSFLVPLQQFGCTAGIPAQSFSFSSS